MIYKYKAPTFEEVAKRLLTIPITSPIPATTHLTIVVGPITFRYRVLEGEMIFRNDAMDQVRYYWLVSRNRTPSTTGVPSGSNLFGYLAPVGYFVGTGITKRVFSGVTPGAEQEYIKLHTHNLNAFAQTINCSIQIEEA